MYYFVVFVLHKSNERHAMNDMHKQKLDNVK
jgi:hypothetical protein